MKSNRPSICLLSALALVASTALATLNVTVNQYSSEPDATGFNGYFPVSSNDLGQAAGTTLTETGTLAAYDGPLTDKYGNPINGAAYLFDGGRAYGGKYPTTDSTASFDPDAATNYWTFYGTWCCITPIPGATVTVTFPPRDGGYDISSVVSLSGYTAGRQVQAYAVAVLAHGSAEWTDLGTVSGGTDDAVLNGFREVQLTVTGADGGLLASGADAVRFTFLNTTEYGMSQDNGVSVYREIDINGVTPVQVSVAEYSSEPNANGVNGYFPVSSGDLGEAAGTVIAATGTTSTYGGPFTDKYGNPMEGVAYLFDGGRAYGGKYATTESNASFDPDAASNYWAFDNTWCAITPAPGAAVTVTFPPRDGGYNISSVVSLSGWGYNRQVQAYTVAFLPHGSAIWTYPGTASGGTDVTVPGGFHEVRLTVTGVSGGWLASGVDAVRFTFLNTTSFGMLEGNGVTVYREIDINGKPVYPKGTLISFR